MYNNYLNTFIRLNGVVYFVEKVTQEAMICYELKEGRMSSPQKELKPRIFEITHVPDFKPQQ